MNFKWCACCVRVTRHAVFEGTAPAPSFDLCQVCGHGAAVEAEEEAS